MRIRIPICMIGCALMVIQSTAIAAEPRRATFNATDTFVNPTDKNTTVQNALDRLKWKPGPFSVTATAGEQNGNAQPDSWFADYDAIVTFPSAHPTGDKQNDTVVLEWFAPRDKQQRPVRGPAMLVLHILDGRMKIARAIARAFRQAGIHAFVMHMPHYGRRRVRGTKPNPQMILNGVRQAVADGRRARDAIASLPNIATTRIGIQGTSLGGFICTAIASSDDVFAPVFPTLAGGDLKSMFKNGQHEVTDIRGKIKKMGVTIKQFHAMLDKIEPNRLAHRISAKHTWMFNAQQDHVVPAANASSLANAIGLSKDHHVWMTGGHVTCIVHLPRIVTIMTKIIHGPDRNK